MICQKREIQGLLSQKSTDIQKYQGLKASIPLSNFKESDGIGVDRRNLMRFTFARSDSIRFFVPTAQPIAYVFCYIYPIMHFAQRYK